MEHEIGHSTQGRNPCPPLHLDTANADDDLLTSDARRVPPHHPPDDADPSLPLMLRLLFGLNGLSLSLLTLPMMYILNTRVAVPLPYLPAYGAIAFLPYSLKPMYAYLCGLWAKHRSNRPTNRNRQHNNHRHTYRYLALFRWLLVGNSICTLLFASIPRGGVLAVFVVAFLRGVTDSWAEFCLGLTLIDHARTNHPGSYETAVSSLQAQSATAGNLGAWTASLVTCLVLVGRRFASEEDDEEQQPQLTGGLTNGLVIATALFQLVGVASVQVWETGQSKRANANGNGNDNWNGDGIYDELPSSETRYDANGTGDDGSDNPVRFGRDNAVLSTESDFLRDEESSHPSYSSLEDIASDEESAASLSIETTDLFGNPRNGSWPFTRIAKWILIVLLQCILVAIALKGPFVEATSHFVWIVLMSTLLIGIVFTAVALYCKLRKSDDIGVSDDTTTLNVGLFLVLKNAIPSDSAILGSFFYALFGTNQPLLLQFLSFLGMGVSSLSSWSYTRIFSKRFGSGRPLVGLIAGTVVLASLASLMHIAVFRVYQRSEHGEEGNEELSPSRRLLLIAIAAKFVTTFCDEWAFLPELVLATTSVRVPTSTGSLSSPANIASHREADGPVGNGAIVSGTPAENLGGSHERDRLEDDDDDEDQRQRIAIEYGTLVSCIDFGDQLGSLLAAPLVAAWQISRENGFLHLDRLILFCSLANLVLTLGLLPLLWTSTSKQRR